MSEGIRGKCESCKYREDCPDYLDVLIQDNKEQLSSRIKTMTLVIDCPNYERRRQ
jgi:hypothetical protein